ncbi:MAG TPA: rhodanese-like domain-containing protein [Steroidobacteraceae bacterium]|nr:rhodanese-like domain-containing protein [Steroidobacteraceae bacterium]
MDRLIEYAGHHPLLFGAALGAAVLVALYEWWFAGRNAGGVSPQELIRLMNQGALVLDLRSDAEYAAGHVTGARQLPVSDLAKAGETLKKHRDKPVVVYCDRGSSAGAAVRKLAEQGFSKVAPLRGGIAAWRSENLPLAKS